MVSPTDPDKLFRLDNRLPFSHAFGALRLSWSSPRGAARAASALVRALLNATSFFEPGRMRCGGRPCGPPKGHQQRISIGKTVCKSRCGRNECMQHWSILEENCNARLGVLTFAITAAMEHTPSAFQLRLKRKVAAEHGKEWYRRATVNTPYERLTTYLSPRVYKLFGGFIGFLASWYLACFAIQKSILSIHFFGVFGT